MAATGVQQKQKNPYVDKRMATHRRRWGIEIIYSRGAVKNSLNALKQKRMLGLLGDQDGGARGIFVPFFGKIASTPPGPALIRVKSKAPIAFAYAIRIAKFKFRLGIEPLNIDDNFEYTEENLKLITRAYLEILEKYIRKYPEQYFWMHRRWRTTYVKNDH
jgi:KDO2-lipid IV(A) lauroyltransferase